MKRTFVLFFLFACSSSTQTNDAGADAAADASTDASTETSTEAGPEAATDASSANVGSSASIACNTNGLYVATSASAITCGSSISMQLVKPYLQLRIAGTSVGTYDVAADCAQGGNVVEATYDDAQGTHDAISGSVTITTVGNTVGGSYDLDFGTSKQKAAFSAPYCP